MCLVMLEILFTWTMRVSSLSWAISDLNSTNLYWDVMEVLMRVPRVNIEHQPDCVEEHNRWHQLPTMPMWVRERGAKFLRVAKRIHRAKELPRLLEGAIPIDWSICVGNTLPFIDIEMEVSFTFSRFIRDKDRPWRRPSSGYYVSLLANGMKTETFHPWLTKSFLDGPGWVHHLSAK